MLTEIFGDSPRVKLLDFLLDNVDLDYTISQLHQFTGISRPTLYLLTEGMEGEGMLLMTRQVGGSRFFRINVEHSKVAWMIRAEFEGINKAVNALPGDRAPRARKLRTRKPQARGSPASLPRMPRTRRSVRARPS